MIIIGHVLCLAAHRGGMGGDQNTSISYAYNKSFSATTSLSNNTFAHLLHHSVTYSLHTFSQQKYHHTILAHSSIFLQPLSNTYNSAHLIHQYPPSLSNSPLVNNKCSTLTHRTPLIYNNLHLFLSSNPAESVHSQNSSLTTS